MTRRHYLRGRTRDERFLWRMVIAILAVGIVVGAAVDAAVPAWIHVEADEAANPKSKPAPEPVPTDSSAWDRLDELAARGQWLDVWRGIPHLMAIRWSHVGPAALAALTGACWLAILLQAVQVRSWRDVRLWAPLAGVVLGALSTCITAFLILWQEHRWGIVDAENLMGGLRSYLVGVGFREELSKLLCFLPLLPVVVWARDELAAFVAAACVGVGFGMEENVGYILGSGGADTFGRVLSAVPAHMALTGLVGLAAYRACRWPRDWGPQFFAMFGVMVLAHAVYDALISLPALEDFSIGSTIIFVLLMYQFFRELRPLQSRRVDTVSLTANFLFCVSVVAAATFVYLSAAVGWRVAGQVQAQSIAGDAVIVYLFLREMPETMVKI